MKRFAVYYAPPAGAFADRAAAWLGRDAITPEPVPHPDLGLPLAEITTDPRRYGFHATLKPPFRLAQGQTETGLHLALDLMARRLPRVQLQALQIDELGGFLALTPVGDVAELQELAAALVTELDPFRATLTEAEIARRRPESLSPRQRELLDLWGYPYVLEEFRFHMTLTDRLKGARAAKAKAAAQTWFGPVLPTPFEINEICLFGECEDGTFELCHRYALSA